MIRRIQFTALANRRHAGVGEDRQRERLAFDVVGLALARRMTLMDALHQKVGRGATEERDDAEGDERESARAFVPRR